MTFILANLKNIFFSLICNFSVILIGLIGLCLLVVLHELGHFIFCKIFNVYTPSFSIGFGPRLFEKKIGDTVFAISAIPLGGYVEMAGAQEVGQGEQAHANLKGERSFDSKPYWQKLLIMSGGIIFNIIFAYLALAFLFYKGSVCVGSLCNKYPALIYKVIKDSKAEKIGLQAEDKIIGINNVKIKKIKKLNSLLDSYIDKTVNLKIERNNKEENFEVKIEAKKINNKEKADLSGIIWYVKPMPFKDSLKASASSLISIVKELFNSFRNVVKNKDNFGGPLLIIAQLKESLSIGWKVFALMLSFISLNLAVLNLIPLPIFDGGQILFYSIEAATGKPLSEKVRYYIHYFTWILVILLTVYMTFKDILKIGEKFFREKTDIPSKS